MLFLKYILEYINETASCEYMYEVPYLSLSDNMFFISLREKATFRLRRLLLDTCVIASTVF